jgi:ferredoxin
VFATWGGEDGAALWQARTFLRLRGFRIAASGGASYPFQWTQVTAPPTAEDAAPMVERGDHEAREFARTLLERPGTRAAGLSPGLLATLICMPISWLYRSIGRHGLAAMNAADARCKACGNCARDCPVDAIVMAGPPDAEACPALSTFPRTLFCSRPWSCSARGSSLPPSSLCSSRWRGYRPCGD